MAERTQHNQTVTARSASRSRQEYLRQDEVARRSNIIHTQPKRDRRFKEYLRSHKRLRELEPSPTMPKEDAKRIQAILKLAESSSTTAFIPQSPGSLTRFMFQSPAESHYKNARRQAIEHGDARLAKAISVRAAERFESIGKNPVAFEWAKISGDREVLTRIGINAAKEHKNLADSIYMNNLFENRRHMKNCRKAIEYYRDSGFIDLAKRVGVEAAKRYEAYGDLCAQSPISSITGLAFGYVRAIRWARAAGDDELAKRIHDKVVDIYEKNIIVNPVSLFVAGAMGDHEQTKVIREILENRKISGMKLILGEN